MSTLTIFLLDSENVSVNALSTRFIVQGLCQTAQTGFRVSKSRSPLIAALLRRPLHSQTLTLLLVQDSRSPEQISLIAGKCLLSRGRGQQALRNSGQGRSRKWARPLTLKRWEYRSIIIILM